MPYSYRIDQTLRFVFDKGEGRVTDAEMWAAQDRMIDDPALDPSFDRIIDCTDVTEFAVSGDTIRQLARRSPFDANVRRAFVVKSDLVFGMARMFQSYVDSDAQQSRIFESMAQARQWFGLD